MNSARILVVLSACVPICATAQSGKSARQIYDDTSPSVFLVISNDSSGNPNIFGTGFEVAPRTIATNAHVIAGGSPLIVIGSTRTPASVVNIDSINDLAILSVGTDLPSSSTPLPLSKQQPSPGDRVFAIGNPEGLENTISEGIVSAIREVSYVRTLIQITTPISHGSSGGPILDRHGEVIAVTVSTRTDGQNLNFAIPVTYLNNLLQAKPGSANSSLTPAKLGELNAAFNKEKFSTTPDSPSVARLNDIRGAIRLATSQTDNVHLLSQLMCITYDEAPDLAGDAIADAAHKLIVIGPASDGEPHAVLAYEYSYEVVNHLSPELTSLQQKGESEADLSLKIGGRGSATADYAKGVLLAVQKNPEGVQLLQKVVTEDAKLFACGYSLRTYAYRNLIGLADNANSYQEAERYFQSFAATGEVTASDWEREGARRAGHEDFLGAAVAYEKTESTHPINACMAANEYRVARGDYSENVLTEGKKCFDAYAKSGAVSGTTSNLQLAILHRAMATILNNRGNYAEALSHAKDGTTLDPYDHESVYEEARSFEKLGRTQECISAAQHAIAISHDGSLRYDFQLGSCYFDAQNWKAAAASFQTAAKDPVDAVAAYRVAQSLRKQGNLAEAQVWSQEALRRRPDEQLKAEIIASQK